MGEQQNLKSSQVKKTKNKRKEKGSQADAGIVLLFVIPMLGILS